MVKKLLALAMVSALVGCVTNVDSDDTMDSDEELAEGSQALMCEDCENDPPPPPGGGGTTNYNVTGSNVICNYSWVGQYCDKHCYQALGGDMVTSWVETVDAQYCVNPPPPKHFRTLLSEHVVAHWATFLNGGSGDEYVNTGVQMPAGCEVVYSEGLHYHDSVPQYPTSTLVDHGSHGFSTNRYSTTVNGLGAKVHWWHEWNSGIFVRVAYTITEPDGVDCSVPGATRDP